MRLLSIHATRVIWLFSTNDLNPIGLGLRNLFSDLQERYKFGIMPNAAQVHEFVTKKQGVPFSAGTFTSSKGAVTISVTIFSDGITVDSRADSSASDEFLTDLLTWLHSKHGLVDFKTLRINKSYISEVYFTMEKSLNSLNGPVSKVAVGLGKTVPSVTKNLHFEISGISFSPDPEQNSKHVNFRIERDAKAPFEDSRYYSIAPLPTQDHLSVVKKLTALLK